VIVLRAKRVKFDVTYISLSDKPDWFLKISPHGKVPVLLVDDEPLFESNAIAEYLDETVPPRMHPEDPIARARDRAWTDFVPDFAGAFSKVNYAKTKEDFDAGLEALPRTLAKLEDALAKRGNDGPYFNGPELSLVDASYAPFLYRFHVIDGYAETGALDGFPRLKAWSEALSANDVVTGSVPDDWKDALVAMLRRRETYTATFLPEAAAAE
jgi:glutathione S-transferase